jgi:cell shape-determining protein MreD
LVLGLILAVLGTTLFSWWSLGPLRLEPLIVLVVSAGYCLPLILGFVVVWALGYLADLVSGGVLGLNLVIFSVVYVICQLAQRKLNIDSWPFQMLSVGLMTILAHLLMAAGLLLTIGGYALPVNLPLLLLAQGLISALTAPLFFGLTEVLVSLFARFWPQERRVTP